MKKSNVLWKTIIYLTLAFLLLLYSTAMFPLRTIFYKANPPYFHGYITAFMFHTTITMENIFIFISDIIGFLLSITCFILGYRYLYRSYSERTPHRWIPIVLNEVLVLFYFVETMLMFFRNNNTISFINVGINDFFAFVLFFLPIILYGFSPENEKNNTRPQRQ